MNVEAIQRVAKAAATVLVSFLLAVAPLAQAAFFERGEGRISLLTDVVSYRVDDESVSDFDKVFTASTGWKTQKESPFTPSKDLIRIWAKFDLPEVAAVQRVFLDSSPWERVEYFVVRDGKLADRQLQGILVPHSQRATQVGMNPVPSHAGFAAVELLPGSHTTVYARLASNQDYSSIRWLRFYVWDATQVLQGERRDRNIEGIYLGVMLVLIIYNLALFFLVREPSYFYYVIMELGGVLIWCEVFGISGELFWPEHPAWEFTSILVGLAMSTLGVPYFVRYYLDTRRYFPRADSLLRWTVYAGLSLLVLGLALYGIRLWNNIGLLAFAIVGLPPILASFLVIVLALRRRHPQAKHLFLAGLVGVIAVFITSAESFKLLPATDWTIHATQAGNAIAGIILSMGLGFRLRHTRKELAERKIAEAQAQSRHERETRELVEAHNRDLEKKVVERTAELVALRQQSDLLLANILPTAIIDELKENGSSEPRRHEEVSILFTDFSAFTQTVSTMPPKRLVQELDEIFRGFDDIVAEHGLEKIKTIGDAYMAASGLPVACSDHALRCARAGLAMTRFIEARNRRAAIKWGLRVGVHSGAVVAGVVGKNKYAYDVWGDTVNIANRLESAGETDKVNVSAYTFELIREQFECEYRGKLTAKGKGEIDMYFVLREAGTR